MTPHDRAPDPRPALAAPPLAAGARPIRIDGGCAFSLERQASGALALVHNHRQSNGVETDAFLRYACPRIAPIAGDRDILASADAETLALCSRPRVPTNLTLFGRPVRTVSELNGSWLPGDQGEVLQTD